MQQMKKILSVLLITLLARAAMVSAEPAVISLPNSFPGSGGLPQPALPSHLPPAYPEWPERSFRSEIVPPPPAGPYMSSAMSGIDVFPHDTGGLRYESNEQQMESPFFTEDMPWPETPERDRPRPWIPDSGEYNYVPDDIVRQLESTSPVYRQQYPVHQHFPRFPPPPPVRQPSFGYYR